MKIFEKIQKFLKIGKYKEAEEIKLLTDGEKHTKDNQFKKGLYFGSVSHINQPTIEECIDEFIKQYQVQLDVKESEEQSKDKEDRQSGTNMPYHAYSRMFCGEEQIGFNLENQRKLVEFVRSKKCTSCYQYSDDRIVFMHIAGEDGIEEHKDRNVERIYLNCERKYIAVLTKAIFEEIKDIAGSKLQMKCVSEQFAGFGTDEETKEVKNYQRNDRIVIYAENHQKAEEICNSISSLKRSKPELFKGIKSIPLLKNRDGFMVLADKKSYEFHTKTPIGDASGRTFNSYISDILYQSVISGFDKLVGVDSNNTSYTLKERMAEYTRIYLNDMTEQDEKKIISDCSKLFCDICRNAGIELNQSGDGERQMSYKGE